MKLTVSVIKNPRQLVSYGTPNGRANKAFRTARTRPKVSSSRVHEGAGVEPIDPRAAVGPVPRLSNVNKG